MADSPDNEDQKLFQDDFQEVLLDEPADKAAKKAEKAKNQPASLDVLDGLVTQAKMEEITPENNPETSAGQTQEPSAALTLQASDSTDTATILSPEKLLSASLQVAIQEPQDVDEQTDESDEFPEKTDIASKAKPEYPQDAHMDAAPAVALEPVRVLEAALFLANKPMSHKQLQDLLTVPRDRLDALLGELATSVPKESSFELFVNEHGAALQLKPHYLHRVARLSKEVELSKKAMRILALVAKKKELMQSDLKHFFKGEIYAYVTELKMAGYLESKKAGNTRRLKPTSKFYESFQIKE